LAAADEFGVVVTITPGLNAATVAEHTVALMLALMRKVADQDLRVKSGRWERVGEFAPIELAGRTVGLLGAGTIGGKVIQRLVGFDVKMIFFDPAVAEMERATRVDSLGQLLAASDVLSLHLPLTVGTRGILGAVEFRQMKSTALIVNTSRGGLIDQVALFAALKQGIISGAALDVFAQEPPSPEIFKDVPNLVCSPHLAGLSKESIRRMTVSATDSVLAALAGEIPRTSVNSPAKRRAAKANPA
jgi:phosphoglycerate dehydrogenase-like enzyme